MGDISEKLIVHRPAQNVCPYCRSETELGISMIGCAGCGAIYHSSCMAELGGGSACASCNSDIRTKGSIDYVLKTSPVKKDLETIAENSTQICDGEKSDSELKIYSKATGYLVKDLVSFPFKLGYDTLKGWYTAHFTVMEREENEHWELFNKRAKSNAIRAGIIDFIASTAIVYPLLYSSFDQVAPSLVFASILGPCMGCMFGLLARVQQDDRKSHSMYGRRGQTDCDRGLNRLIRDSYRSSKSIISDCCESVKNHYLKKARGNENE